LNEKTGKKGGAGRTASKRKVRKREGGERKAPSAPSEGEPCFDPQELRGRKKGLRVCQKKGFPRGESYSLGKMGEVLRREWLRKGVATIPAQRPEKKGRRSCVGGGKRGV